MPPSKGRTSSGKFKAGSRAAKMATNKRSNAAKRGAARRKRPGF
jgi:hypothetical protein